MESTRTLKPIFENKKHGPGGGFALLKQYWEQFDLSLLYMGMDKHSGVPARQMLFIYVCGLISGSTSVNQISRLLSTSPPSPIHREPDNHYTMCLEPVHRPKS